MHVRMEETNNQDADLVVMFRGELVERVQETRRISRALLAQGLLSEEEYSDVRAGQSSQDRMRLLLQALDCRQQQGREALYRLLQEHEPELTLEMEHAQFVSEHREELIRQVTRVEPVANRLLSQGLVSEEAYFAVCYAERGEDRMTELFKVLDTEGAAVRGGFYRTLLHCEPLLYRELEKERVMKMCGIGREREQLRRRTDELEKENERLEKRREELQKDERKMEREREEMRKERDDLERSRAEREWEKEGLAERERAELVELRNEIQRERELLRMKRVKTEIELKSQRIYGEE